MDAAPPQLRNSEVPPAGGHLRQAPCVLVGQQLQSAFSDAVTLLAAVGLVGDGHFNWPHHECRQQICLGEMFPVSQAQCFHHCLPRHLTFHHRQQCSDLRGNLRGGFGTNLFSKSFTHRPPHHRPKLLRFALIEQIDLRPGTQRPWDAGAQAAIRQDVGDVSGRCLGLMISTRSVNTRRRTVRAYAVSPASKVLENFI